MNGGIERGLSGRWRTVQPRKGTSHRHPLRRERSWTQQATYRAIPLVETSGIRHIHRGSKRVVVAKGRREEAVRRDGWWLRSRRLGRRRRCAVLETGFLGRRANRACAAAAFGPVPLRGAAPCRPHSSGAGRHPPSPLQHGRKALNSALATWQRQPRLGVTDSRPSVDRAERALLPGAPPAFLLSCALSVHVVTHFSIGLLVFSLFRKIFFKY